MKLNKDIDKNYSSKLNYKTKICNKLKDINFLKDVAFIFVVLSILMIITIFIVPLGLERYSDYMFETMYPKSEAEYITKNIKLEKVIEDLDEEYVLIKTTITNDGDCEAWLRRNFLNISNINCNEKECKHEEWYCYSTYIKLCYYDEKGNMSIYLKPKESKVIEFKVPKVFNASDEYIIKHELFFTIFGEDMSSKIEGIVISGGIVEE